MDHEPVLISTIAIGLVAAFVGGLIAQRLRLPSIVGYIAAGVALGPFTPGVIADPEIASELAEIGVILLMFGVGIEFSIKDLLAVRRIAVPGAIGQFAIATLLGIGLGSRSAGASVVGSILGLAISVASTVVLLRTLNDRNELDTPQGRIAVGWLIVEDLFTVVILVVLPTIAPLIGGVAAASGGTDADALATVGSVVLALGKAAGFAVIMIVVGARLVPWLLNLVARDGSRELFTLAVLAIALGIAFVSSTVFGVSFALGAFLAGAVVGESDMSHQAAADALPLRDAFAVLFFVSVGMLLDPSFLVTYPLAILAMVGLIVVSKALVKFAIVTLFGYPLRTGLTVGVGLAQIGEFSFILGTVGATLGLLPAEGFQLIVAGSLLSIALNPFLFRAIDPLDRRLRAAAGPDPLARATSRRPGDAGNHARASPAPRPRDPGGLRPRRATDRPGARPSRVQVRRPHAAATRSGPAPGSGRRRHLRRCLERGRARTSARRDGSTRHRGQLGSARHATGRGTGAGGESGDRLRRAHAQRHGGGPPARRHEPDPDGARGARTRGPDGALLTPPVRRRLARGRGDRPGAATALDPGHRGGRRRRRRRTVQALARPGARPAWRRDERSRWDE